MKYELNGRLRALVESSGASKEDRDKIIEAGWVSANDIITLYKLKVKSELEAGREVNRDGSVLMRYFNEAKVYHEPVVPQKKTPEFLKQMEMLRAKQRELEYQKMVHKDFQGETLQEMMQREDDRRKGKDYSAAQMGKEVKSQLTTVVNVLVTVVSVAYAVWYWTGTSTNMALQSRVLWALFFALLVLVAEVTVFGGYLGKVEDARAKERKKQDTIRVVETITFQGGKKGKKSKKRKMIKQD